MSRTGFPGFTLLEVLTVVIVIAVLVAIAVPSWQQHVMRTRRASATEMLTHLQIAQERFFGRHARYATPDELSRAEPVGLGLPAASDTAPYRLTLDTAPDGLAFSATARANGAQAGDTYCVTFTIDHVGMRTATDAAGVDRSLDCWR